MEEIIFQPFKSPKNVATSLDKCQKIWFLLCHICMYETDLSVSAAMLIHDNMLTVVDLHLYSFVKYSYYLFCSSLYWCCYASLSWENHKAMKSVISHV